MEHIWKAPYTYHHLHCQQLPFGDWYACIYQSYSIAHGAIIVIGSVYFPEIAGLGLNVWTDMPTSPAIAYLVLSLALNTVLTLLIVYRILSIRSTVREALGKQHGRLYTSLFALIIESASLYTIVAIISVIACGLNSPIQYALLPMLGQLQVGNLVTGIAHETKHSHGFHRRFPR